MAEYIDRADAIDAVKHAWAKGLEPTQFLETVKTADVAPVQKGYWRKFVGTRYCGIRKDGNPIYRDSYSYDCSNCGRGSIIRERYCPSCGAKMDGGKDNAAD